jgi:hypothetical protein
MKLMEMKPRGDLSSTGYALASPGKEYLVLQSSDGPFTVILDPGTYSAEWFSIGERTSIRGEDTTVEHPTETTFSSPSQAPGPTVLYLRNVSTP